MSLRTLRGFTLIEMLVVIAIIMFLLSLAVIAVFPLLAKSKFTQTLTTLRKIQMGLDRFVEKFPTRIYGAVKKGGYPKRAELPDNGAYTVSAWADGEWLRLILSPKDADITAYLQTYRITSSALATEECKESLNQVQVRLNNRNIAPFGAFVDAWDQSINYRAPGEDHSAETNYRQQKGENNKSSGGKPDVWSPGQDNVDWYALGNKAQWNTKVNDPTQSGNNALSDDIASWFPGDAR